MASTSPASASRTACSTASPAILPASWGSRERGAVPSDATEGPAPRSPLPTMVISASSGPSASALATTSGPIPRGSPSVTASRGTTPLEPDGGVGRTGQQVEVVFDGELLAQAVADAVLHLVERQLALGEALDQLEHEKAWSRARAAPLDNGLTAGGAPAGRWGCWGWAREGASKPTGTQWANPSCTEPACRRAIASCAAEIV